MTLLGVCVWALLRSLAVAGAAVTLAWLVQPLLSPAAGRRTRYLAWALLLTPWFTPFILTGYAYSNFWLSLIRCPWWNQLLYVALLTLRIAPAGALALYFAPPPPLSPQARHVARLVPRSPRTWHEKLAFLVRGPARNLALAFGLLFILAFQDFELIGLLNVACRQVPSGTWTLWLFEAQVGGLPLAESLRRALLPLACELAVIVPLLAAVYHSERPAPAAAAAHRPASLVRCALAWSCLGLAVVAVSLLPGLIVLRGAVRDLSAATMVLKQMSWAVAFAGAAAGAAYGLVAWLIPPRPSGRAGTPRLLAALLLAGLGLLGPLVVSLLTLAVFQQPLLSRLYDTPLPLLLGLVIVLLPAALLLRVLLLATRPLEGLHLARLLCQSPAARQRRAGWQLRWRLSGQPRAGLVFVLLCWVYLDLTVPALLAPADITPVSVWLYNFMHYGQVSAYSAMLLGAMAAPVLILALGALTRGAVYWWLERG